MAFFEADEQVDPRKPWWTAKIVRMKLGEWCSTGFEFMSVYILSTWWLVAENSSVREVRCRPTSSKRVPHSLGEATALSLSQPDPLAPARFPAQTNGACPLFRHVENATKLMN